MNELSHLFGRMGIDTHEVLEAAGTKWNFLPFKPGLVGGHCIGVDPYYLTHKAEELGYHPQIILSGRRINDEMACHVGRGIVKKLISSGRVLSKTTIAVMGITFKEGCPDIRNSKIFDLISELQSWGLNILVTDPLAEIDAVKKTHNLDLINLRQLPLVDGIIVAVAHQQYKELSPMVLRNYCKSETLIQPLMADIKAIYNRSELINVGFDVFRI